MFETLPLNAKNLILLSLHLRDLAILAKCSTGSYKFVSEDLRTLDFSKRPNWFTDRIVKAQLRKYLGTETPWARSLDFSGCQLVTWDTIVWSIKLLPRLQRIVLKNMRISNSLLKVCKKQGITHFELNGTSLTTETAPTLPHSKCLQLSFSSLSLPKRSFKCLRKLSMSGYTLMNAPVERFIRGTKTLTHLRLHKGSSKFPLKFVICSLCEILPDLLVLEITLAEKEAVGWEDLTDIMRWDPLPVNERLWKLNLAGSALLEEQYYYFHNCFPNIRSLDLSGCVTLENLWLLENYKQLRELKLDGLGHLVGDDLLEQLVDNDYLNFVERLSIARCYDIGSSVRHLSKLSHLYFLDISGLYKISAEDLENLVPPSLTLLCAFGVYALEQKPRMKEGLTVQYRKRVEGSVVWTYRERNFDYQTPRPYSGKLPMRCAFWKTGGIQTWEAKTNYISEEEEDSDSVDSSDEEKEEEKMAPEVKSDQPDLRIPPPVEKTTICTDCSQEIDALAPEDHALVCPNRKIACPLSCSCPEQVGPRRFIRHLRECPAYTISCYICHNTVHRSEHKQHVLGHNAEQEWDSTNRLRIFNSVVEVERLSREELDNTVVVLECKHCGDRMFYNDYDSHSCPTSDDLRPVEVVRHNLSLLEFQKLLNPLVAKMGVTEPAPRLSMPNRHSVLRPVGISLLPLDELQELEDSKKSESSFSPSIDQDEFEMMEEKITRRLNQIPSLSGITIEQLNKRRKYSIREIQLEVGKKKSLLKNESCGTAEKEEKQNSVPTGGLLEALDLGDNDSSSGQTGGLLEPLAIGEEINDSFGAGALLQPFDLNDVNSGISPDDACLQPLVSEDSNTPIVGLLQPQDLGDTDTNNHNFLQPLDLGDEEDDSETTAGLMQPLDIGQNWNDNAPKGKLLQPLDSRDDIDCNILTEGFLQPLDIGDQEDDSLVTDGLLQPLDIDDEDVSNQEFRQPMSIEAIGHYCTNQDVKPSENKEEANPNVLAYNRILTRAQIPVELEQKHFLMNPSDSSIIALQGKERSDCSVIVLQTKEASASSVIVLEKDKRPSDISIVGVKPSDVDSDNSLRPLN